MTDKLVNPNVLLPINANPLHIGHIISIYQALKVSDKLHVVLYDNIIVASPMETKKMLEVIFSHQIHDNKMDVSINKANFSKLSELPKEFIDDETVYTIVTTSRHVYSNLESKGYPCLVLFDHPIGWRDGFYTTAYLRSVALHNIELRIGNMRKKL